MTTPVSCCIIGDVNIDYVADLSATPIGGSANACFFTPIVASVGGNGTFFAEAAREAGFADVTLLCAIGGDIAGVRAAEHLQQLGVTVHAAPSARQTGQVMIIYQPDDRRIMVADRGANQDFRPPAPHVLTGLAGQAALLYISGYTLLDREQRAYVHTIAQAFRHGSAQVLVDMVPHDVWRTHSWTEYVALCACANCAAVELNTVSAFLKGRPAAVAPEEAARLLLRDFEFCLIRINDVSDFLVADQGRQQFVTIPYRRTVSSLRFTDRVIACATRQYAADPAAFFASDTWVTDAVQAVSGGVSS